jgi:hypothetical protein
MTWFLLEMFGVPVKRLRFVPRSAVQVGARLAVVLTGVTGLFALFGVVIQAYVGCGVSFDGCQEQHCEPLLSR